MRIREYKPDDLAGLRRLFYETIRNINIKDYSPEQTEVWSNRAGGLKNEFFASLYTVVAEDDGGRIICYGNIDDTGYLDHLYTHKDFQGRGAAGAVCGELERYALEKGAETVTVHASITARPFFESRGYTVAERREVELDGVGFINYLMKKELRRV